MVGIFTKGWHSDHCTYEQGRKYSDFSCPDTSTTMSMSLVAFDETGSYLGHLASGDFFRFKCLEGDTLPTLPDYMGGDASGQIGMLKVIPYWSSLDPGVYTTTITFTAHVALYI